MSASFNDLINVSRLRAECDSFGYLTRETNRDKTESPPELQIHNTTNQQNAFVQVTGTLRIYDNKGEFAVELTTFPLAMEYIKRLIGNPAQ